MGRAVGSLMGGAARRLLSLRFRTKLVAVCVLASVASASGGAYALAVQVDLTHRVEATYRSSVLPTQYAHAAREAMLEGNHVALKELAGTGTTCAASNSCSVKQARAAVAGEVKIFDDAADQSLTQLAGTPLTTDERNLLAALRPQVKAYRAAVRQLLAYTSRDTTLDGLMTNADNTFLAADDTLKKLNDLTLATGRANDADTRATASAARATTIALLTIALAFALVGSFLLARAIARPVLAVSRALRRVAEGDLTPRVHPRGRDEVAEMGRSLNEALDRITETVADIDESVDVLASSSEELSAVSQQLAGGAEETSAQAAAVSSSVTQVDAHVQAVASAAEQMGASIREIARNANDAAQVAANASALADSAQSTVARLGDASTEIGTVIKVISAIAEQTHLLALNATIEAARAGDAGRGFAVVAHEVKELATETAKATESIEPLIRSLQGESRAVTEVFDDIARITTSILEAQSTIASAVEEQTATTNSIAASITEAATGSGEIARNINGVASGASATSGGATNTQRAAQQLAELSSSLAGQVARFRYDD